MSQNDDIMITKNKLKTSEIRIVCKTLIVFKYSSE